jgi:transposase
MSNSITQFHGLDPREILKPIQELKTQFEELKKHFQPKEPKQYLTRLEVSKMFSVDLSTVHNWTKKGILNAKQIGGRVFYLRSEVENSIVELSK